MFRVVADVVRPVDLPRLTRGRHCEGQCGACFFGRLYGILFEVASGLKTVKGRPGFRKVLDVLLRGQWEERAKCSDVYVGQ